MVDGLRSIIFFALVCLIAGALVMMNAALIGTVFAYWGVAISKTGALWTSIIMLGIGVAFKAVE